MHIPGLHYKLCYGNSNQSHASASSGQLPKGPGVIVSSTAASHIIYSFTPSHGEHSKLHSDNGQLFLNGAVEKH